MRAPRTRSRRIRVAGFAAAIAALPGLAADAELERYRLRRTWIDSDQFGSFVYRPCTAPGYTVKTCTGIAVVDAGSPSSVLSSFQFIQQTTLTFVVPIFAGQWFFSTHEIESARLPATGQGSTGAGSTLRWGVVSGWSISGSRWCNAAAFPVGCTFAGGLQEETVDPTLPSDFYDIGTWTFHGTGFTAAPFIKLYFTSNSRNAADRYAGRRIDGPGVPALPLLGLAGAGVALAAGSAAALRRMRES